jgi:hypothetical protein
MNFIEQIDKSTLGDGALIAESEQFAIYAVGADTYLLVQRHQSMPWTGVQFSGDGVFRVGSLMVNAMRHLYRDVASNLSPSTLEAKSANKTAS